MRAWAAPDQRAALGGHIGVRRSADRMGRAQEEPIGPICLPAGDGWHRTCGEEWLGGGTHPLRHRSIRAVGGTDGLEDAGHVGRHWAPGVVGIGDPIVRSSGRPFDSTRGARQWAPGPLFVRRRCQVPIRIGLGDALAAERGPSVGFTLAASVTVSVWGPRGRLSPPWLVGAEDPPGPIG